MFIDVKINAMQNSLNISIPSENIVFNVNGLVLLDAGLKRVLSLGEISEESLRSKELEQALKLDEANYTQFVFYHSAFNAYKWENIKKLAEEDVEKGTDNIWKVVKKDFIFVYPFSPEGLSASNALIMLHYYIKINASKSIRPGLFGKLAAFSDSYSYDINIEDYENARESEKADFEKELAALCQTKYKYVKKLILNGKSLL